MARLLLWTKMKVTTCKSASRTPTVYLLLSFTPLSHTHANRVTDPTSNADFSVIIPSKDFKEIELGHTCVPVPDAPRNIDAGANATLQIVYIADFDKPENQTFYACADITYVLESDFSTQIPCFNATTGDTGTPTTGGGSGSQSSASPSASPESKKKKSGISGGAIAGAVVGSVVGAAILAAAGVYLYRRRQQQKRIDAMTRSSRNVAWEHGAAVPGHVKGKDSTSQHSVGLRDM